MGGLQFVKFVRRVIELHVRIPMKQTLPWIVVVLAATLVGCAAVATDATKATYASEGAVIRGQWSGPLTLPPPKPFVGIGRVDGRPLSRNAMAVGPIIVDPGSRTLTVFGHDYHGFKGEVGKVDLRVDLKAGHSYLVRFEHKENEMTFWVEDVETHELAGGRQSTTEITPEKSGGSLNLPMFGPGIM